MVTPPIPTCWRCGSPVFNHLLRGYVCPHCENIKALKNIARNQQPVQRDNHYNNRYQHEEYHQDNNIFLQEDNPFTSFLLGCAVWFVIGYFVYKMFV